MQDQFILKDKTVLVTRSGHQAKELSARLTNLGAKVIEMPMIEIVEPTSFTELDKCIKRLDQFDWIIFTSKNSVHYFIQRAQSLLAKSISQVLALRPTHIAAIGINTSRLLNQHALTVNYFPNEFERESFLKRFPGYPNLHGKKFLWPRTNIADNYLLEKLSKAGAEVCIVEAYRSQLPDNLAHIAKELAFLLHNKRIDVITLTSAQTVQNFVDVLRQIISSQTPKVTNEGFSNLLENVKLVSIGPQTTARLRSLSLPACLEASPHDLEGVVQAIVSYAASMVSC